MAESTVKKMKQVKVRLKEKGVKGSKLVLPIAPERVNIRGSAKYRSYEMVNGNTIMLPKGKECEAISWQGVFFGEGRIRAGFMVKQRYISPQKCVRKLQKWRDKGAPLALVIAGTNINIDVTIARFDYEADGGFGDLSYSIEFMQYKPLKIYTTKELKIDKKTNDRPTEKNGGSYTIKAGDNLWNIAQSYLGDGNRWGEIYDLNKQTIEDTAKKYGRTGSDHGHWIYPGGIITLPAK